MDFSIPEALRRKVDDFDAFLDEHMDPHLGAWVKEETIPRSFFEALGGAGWLGYEERDGAIVEQNAMLQILLFEALAKRSPGVAVAYLVQLSLGSLGVFLFASPEQRKRYLVPAVQGKTLLCLGNTESFAGSDVANIRMTAREEKGGFVLDGAKAYVTNGAIADQVLVTALTDPQGERNRRMSMFIVDLEAAGVTRKKLNKRVWYPADLTRLTFKDVFVPAEAMLGERGRGLRQVLTIFTHSRVNITAMTLGNAVGAFEMGVAHAKRREIFGTKLIEFQAKGFEAADFAARLEAARLMLYKAALAREAGGDFRVESSMAKYLTVDLAGEVSRWAADLFGAASVVFDHPVHKFPMDAWASGLGEGTQDVQKLVILRSLLAEGKK